MSNNCPTPKHNAIRFHLILPVTRIGIGLFSFDPVEQFLGVSIPDILEPLRFGQVERRPSQAGPGVDCYPLALPVGEGPLCQRSCRLA